MPHSVLSLNPLAATILLAIGLHPAMAQEQQPTPPAEDCRADPDAGTGPQADGQQPAPTQQDADKLKRCKGVLTPPAAGDPAIEVAPPDTGTTPVVPPGAVPQQPAPETAPGTTG